MSGHNKNRVSECEQLFIEHQQLTTQLLADCANKLLFYNDNENRYEYPMFIINCIYEYVIQWRWFSKEEFIKYQINQRVMEVIDSKKRKEIVGTAYIEGIEISQNEKHLFEFRYIKGKGMDAIIGIVDNKFEWNQIRMGVGNMSNCFNWGIRYDGMICYNDDMDKWDTKVCTQWKDGDTISIVIDTTSEIESLVELWINNGQKKKELKISHSIHNIVYPYKIAASAARNGGFAIVGGIKLL